MSSKTKKTNKKITKSVSSRSNNNLLVVVIIVLFALLSTILVFKSYAAPKNSTSSTTSSVSLNATNPAFGDTVYFSSTFPRLKGNITPRISIWCFQDVNGDGTVNTTDLSGADLVWGDANAYYSPYKLGGDGWSKWIERGGGAASCRAQLFYFTYDNNKQQIVNDLAWTQFEVSK